MSSDMIIIGSPFVVLFIVKMILNIFKIEMETPKLEDNLTVKYKIKIKEVE